MIRGGTVAAGLGWPGSDGVPSGGLGWPARPREPDGAAPAQLTDQEENP